MKPETSGLRQKAVLWERVGFDRYGEHKVVDADRREISARWKYVNKQMIDPKGNTIAIDAVMKVSEAIDIGSVVWLGRLQDLPSPATGLMQVVGVRYSTDVMNRSSVRILDLARLKDSLPT